MCTSTERWVWAALLVAGCGQTAEPLVFSNFCDARPLAYCDVSRPECSRPLIDYLGCLAEWPSPAGLSVELRPELMRTATTAHSLDGTWAALRLLELDRGDGVLMAEVRAELEPAERRLLLSARAAPFEDRDTVWALAAAAGQAMVYEHLDVPRLAEERAASYDAGLALDALIQGTGWIYADMLIAGLDRSSYLDSLSWAPTYRLDQHPTLEAAEAGRPLLTAKLAFGEAYGRAMLSRAWAMEQTGGVRQLLSAPPRSSAEVLAAIRRASNGSYEPFVSLPAAAPDALKDYTLSGEAELGQLALFIALERWGEGPPLLPEPELRGDRLHAFVRADGAVAAAWILLFQDEGYAARHEQAVARHFSDRADVAVLRDGAALAVTSGSDTLSRSRLKIMAMAELERVRAL